MLGIAHGRPHNFFRDGQIRWSEDVSPPAGSRVIWGEDPPEADEKL